MYASFAVQRFTICHCDKNQVQFVLTPLGEIFTLLLFGV